MSTNTNISYFKCGKNRLASKCTLDKNVKCNYCGTPGHLRKVYMGAKRASANQVEEVLTVERWKYRNSLKRSQWMESRYVSKSTAEPRFLL